jgi:short-subunit dehydrogenase
VASARVRQSAPGRRTSGTAVVTGASSGIGEATAILLTREGFHVALLARRAKRLVKLARRIVSEGGEATAIPVDLSVEAERTRAYRSIKRSLKAVDVLVNSAGLGWYGPAQAMTWRTARQLLRVNAESTAQLTLMFLGDMLRRGTGHIITVGSIAGGIPSQGIALYGGTKSFIDNFSTALHRELKGTGVHVSVIRPGPVRTEFDEAAQRHPNGLPVPTESIGVSPEQVAAGILSIIRRPRRVIYIPSWLRIVPWVELAFGWVIDRIGPLLLKQQMTPRGR